MLNIVTLQKKKVKQTRKTSNKGGKGIVDDTSPKKIGKAIKIKEELIETAVQTQQGVIT